MDVGRSPEPAAVKWKENQHLNLFPGIWCQTGVLNKGRRMYQEPRAEKKFAIKLGRIW